MSRGEGRNGRSVFDIISNGYTRTVRALNGSGTLGVNIPAEWADEHDVQLGDKVAIREAESDEKDDVLELHFD